MSATTHTSGLERVDRADADLHPRLLEALGRDGGVIVTGLIDDAAVAAMNTDFDRSVDETAAGTRAENETISRFWGANTKRFTRLAWRSETFATDVLCNPVLLAVADSLLLPSCASYWMNTGQMMVVGPGSSAQVMHRDADNWPAMNAPDAHEVTVSCMIALSEFTAEVGATRVVPGSHRWTDYQRRATPEETTQAVMPAGSGMIYTGRVLHSAGANVTDDVWRRGLHISYVLGWLTPEEAGPLGVPEDVARRLSPLAQRLLGWRCYDPGDYGARLWTVDYEEVPVGLGW